MHNAEKSASEYSSYTKLHFQIRLKAKDYNENVLAIHTAAEKIVARFRSTSFSADFIAVLKELGARYEDIMPYYDEHSGKLLISPPIPIPQNATATGSVDDTGTSITWLQSLARQSRFGWMTREDVVIMSAVALPIGETRNPDETGTETNLPSSTETDDGAANATSLLDYWLLGIALGCVVVVIIMIYLYMKLRQEYSLLSKDKSTIARNSQSLKKMWSSFTTSLGQKIQSITGSDSLSKEQIMKEIELSKTSLMKEITEEEDGIEEGYEEYYPTVKNAKKASGSGSAHGGKPDLDDDNGFFDDEE